LAYTKIHAIKTTLDKAISYIVNPEKTDDTELSNTGYTIKIVSFVIALILAIVSSYIGENLNFKFGYTRNIYEYVGGGLGFIILITGIFISVKVSKLNTFQEPNGKYKVTVSSNVDMNEFQNRYNIIDFENGIYTVKPKDDVPQQTVSIQEESTAEMTTEIDGKVYKIIPIK